MIRLAVAFKRERISCNAAQRGIKTLTQCGRRVGRGNAAHLYKIDKRQCDGIAFGRIARKGLNNTCPGFEIIIHIQPCAGNGNLFVAFRLYQRQILQLFRRIR